MLDDAIADEPAERRRLDLEIEDTARLLDVLQTHAQMHRGTPFGTALEGLAAEYSRRLQNLEQRRSGMGDDSTRSDES